MHHDQHAGKDPGALPFRIGTAPVNWNNFDLPGWRPEVPFPDILDDMRAAGYEATEWDASFGSGIDDLNRERQARGMEFVGAYRWLDFASDVQFRRDVEDVTPFLATLQGIGAGHLIVADRLRPERVAISGAVPVDRSASLGPEGYDRIAANLAVLSEVASSFGLALHYHNHAGSNIEAPWEVEELANRLAPSRVDLCFDTGHYAFGGGDPLAFVESHRQAIGFVHLKDVDANVLVHARANRWSFHEALRQYIFSPIGEGNARIDAIVASLIASSYQGYVIIEQDTCRGDSTATARANLNTVRQFAHQALDQETTPR